MKRLQKGRLSLDRLVQQLGVERLDGFGEALEGHGLLSGQLYAGFGS